MSAKKGRSYEKKFEVAAPPEAVWKAITEGDELTSWFCQKASCQAARAGSSTSTGAAVPRRRRRSSSGSRASIFAPRPTGQIPPSPPRASPPSRMRSTGTWKAMGESRGSAWSPPASAKGRAGITSTTARSTAGTSTTRRSSTTSRTTAARPAHNVVLYAMLAVPRGRGVESADEPGGAHEGRKSRRSLNRRAIPVRDLRRRRLRGVRPELCAREIVLGDGRELEQGRC